MTQKLRRFFYRFKKNGNNKSDDTAVSYFKLYSYATTVDKVSILCGILFSIICGVFRLLSLMAFGEVNGNLVSYVVGLSGVNLNEHERKLLEEKLYADVEHFVIFNCTIGVLCTVFMYLAGVLLTHSAIRQVFKIRAAFFRKTLDQDIGWYDQHQTGDFASILTDNIEKIEDGIGEKVVSFTFALTCAIAGLVMSLFRGWKLTLICLVNIPLFALSMASITWISTKYSKREMSLYSKASATAEEALSTIRTVVAYDGQEKEMERYNKHVVEAKNNNVKKWVFTALGEGCTWCFLYGGYALNFCYGLGLVVKDRALPEEERVYTPGNIAAIFFALFSSGWHMGCLIPYSEVFGVAKGAAHKVFSVINSEPFINLSNNCGTSLHFQDNIDFHDVHFHYPSRSDMKVLKGFNLSIKYGERVALVGNSGCGKSTVIQLIQRFYDPISGRISIDGTDLNQVNLTELRKKIGVVSQEPALFATTIAENIRYGRLDATHEDIVEAAKRANAHKFIQSLPLGYETVIGEKGTQLSGGQKQRIAIARALIRNPTILLLDEATSALDTTSETEVQAALDQINHECTTIIVAHRLSTVRNVDRIIVVSDGRVEEEGSHPQLMKKMGVYYNLVNSQGFTDISNKGHERNSTSISFSNKSEDVNRNEDVAEYKEETRAKNKNVLVKILHMNKPEWLLLFVGVIASIAKGVSVPMCGFLIGNMIAQLADTDNKSLIESRNQLSIYFVILAVTAGFTAFLQALAFGLAGEKLTMRIRLRMFGAMLAQEIAWFDRKENGVGALCSQLSGDAASVQRAGGYPIGLLINFLSAFLLSCVVSLVLEWRLALVLIVVCHAVFLAIHMEKKSSPGSSNKSQKTLEKSARIAVEVVANIRTVAALGCEEMFCQNYLKELRPSVKTAKQKTHYRSFVVGCSRSLYVFVQAVGIAYGAYLIKTDKVDYGSVIKQVQLIISAVWEVGNALSFAPNLQKGITAGGRVFKLLERIPEMINQADPVEYQWIKSNVDYSRIYFSYPTRPTVSVLNGLDFSVFEGKTVALVGSSGCGKSTCIQLLERFYDPDHGEVSIGDSDIKTMNMKNLRSHLGIVSQEPNLFNKTIAENISYGANDRYVSMDEIVEAAKSANIHNFIVTLPKGYETSLGSKGMQLSGGQKQRMAIARALVRNPKILLLDEATSALDNESEKVVQEALDKAKENRTCITIAHRLTTIQDADLICVIQEGIVAEMGTHTDLLARQGLYYKFYKLQSGQR